MSRVNETINEHIRRVAGRTRSKPAGSTIPLKNRGINTWLRRAAGRVGDSGEPEETDAGAPPAPHIPTANAGAGTGSEPPRKSLSMAEAMNRLIRAKAGWRTWD